MLTGSIFNVQNNTAVVLHTTTAAQIVNTHARGMLPVKKHFGLHFITDTKRRAQSGLHLEDELPVEGPYWKYYTVTSCGLRGL